MPKYDYSCLECDSIEEYVLPVNHDIPFCHYCGNAMTRIYTAVPAHFKGTGWGSDK